MIHHFRTRRHINPPLTRMLHRRRRHTHVDLARTGIQQQFHHVSHRMPAHNGIVHQNDRCTIDRFCVVWRDTKLVPTGLDATGVIFQDECALGRVVGVFDEDLHIGKATGCGVPLSRKNAGTRRAADQCWFSVHHRVIGVQLFTTQPTKGTNGFPIHNALRGCKVDGFKHTMLMGYGLRTSHHRIESVTLFHVSCTPRHWT